MIEESFVSFDTAKMLKEVGFDVPSLYCYTSDGEKEETRIPLNHNFGSDYSRPTQALAARWLREVHRVAVDASFVPPSVDGDVWKYFVGEMDEMVWPGDYDVSDLKYATYEEALEVGLRKAIKLINK